MASTKQTTTRTPQLCVGFVRHKCASQWIVRILSEAASLMGWRHAHFFQSSVHGYSFSDFVGRTQNDVVTCADGRQEEMPALPPFKGFNIIRDPRDMVVSGYFSHRNSHWFKPGTEAALHQEYLRSVSKDEGLLREIDFSGQFIDRMAVWDYTMPNVLELKFEDITTSPYEVFLELFQFLGLLDEEATVSLTSRLYRLPRYLVNMVHTRHRAMPLRFDQPRLPADELLHLVYKHRFERGAGGRRLGDEDAQSTNRRGVHGDWVNHLSPRHMASFAERYGDLAERLGYESAPTWRMVK